MSNGFTFCFSVIARRPISSGTATSNIHHLCHVQAVKIIITNIVIVPFYVILQQHHYINAKIAYKPYLRRTSTIIQLMKCARIWLQHFEYSNMPTQS